LWKDRVKDDRHMLFEGVAHLATRLRQCVQNPDRDRESLGRLRLLDESEHGRQGIEHDTLTGSGDVTEQAAFDRSALGAVRRVVRHTDGDAEVVGNALQVFLEEVLVRAVTPPAIAHEQDGGGVGVQTLAIVAPKHPQAITREGGRVMADSQMHPAVVLGEIIDAMRNDDATGQTGKIMIKHGDRLLAIHFAIAIERSQALFLLGIDAQDGVARFKKLVDEVADMAELGVTVGRIATRQHLGHLAPSKPERIQNTAHDPRADRDRLGVQAVGNLLVTSVHTTSVRMGSPAVRSLIVSWTCSSKAACLTSVFLRPPPGLRTRFPAGSSGRCFNSRMPSCTVCGSHPST